MPARISGYPPFYVTVDLVVLTVRGDALHVLLIERGGQPFKGRWALPGGFCQPDEDVERAAYRELAEEAGVAAEDGVHLEQLATYGDPGRDPRGRVVSVAHVAMGADLPEPSSGTDASDAWWCQLDESLQLDLAFDHGQILRDGIERARAKLEYTTLATTFCRPTFTITELRRVYEVVWGVRLDPGNFHRKVLRSAGFIEPADGERVTRGRAAQLYRAGHERQLRRPIQRAAF